jgi:hypothetical protein
MTTHRHLNSEEIELYSRGTVSEVESASFEEHLLLCERCRQLVEESDTYVAAIRAAAKQLEPADDTKPKPPQSVTSNTARIG